MIWLISASASTDPPRSKKKKEKERTPLSELIASLSPLWLLDPSSCGQQTFPPLGSMDTNWKYLARIDFFLANTAAQCWLHSSPILTGLLAPSDWCHPRYKWLLDLRWSQRCHVLKESQSCTQAFTEAPKISGITNGKLASADEPRQDWRRRARDLLNPKMSCN